METEVRTYVAHRIVDINGIGMFYRTAGDPAKPAILLLHGFPTSSHMFRNLIRDLAEDFYLLAPDLPGFGFTEFRSREAYSYTFDSLFDTVASFVDAIGLDRYLLYVFDYGAPVGLRLAHQRPAQVAGLISQNGNAYEDGLSPAWDPVRKYWKDPSTENRDALRGLLSLDGIRWQYEHGAPSAESIAPETYTLDHSLISRDGVIDLQLDLILDYANNVRAYPDFQSYFRTHRPRTLVIWGDKDPFFLPQGALAFARDNPDAVIELLDTGHFALETHGAHIARRIKNVFTGAR